MLSHFWRKTDQDNLSSIDQIIIEIPGNDLTPEEKLLKKDMEECMQQAIRQLPEKTRIVYCMAKEDHMSYKQISEALDISGKDCQYTHDYSYSQTDGKPAKILLDKFGQL